MLRSLSALALVSILSLAAGCSSTRGPCVGARCDCRDDSTCEFECNVPGCEGTCESVSTCIGTCQDGCDLACNSVSTCDLACGHACTVDCRSLSTCGVDCGEDCRVTCQDASECNVRMVSGTTRCTSVSACNVTCLLPGGREERATDCGGGVWGCGEC